MIPQGSTAQTAVHTPPKNSQFVQITLIRLWILSLLFVLLLMGGNLFITRKALHDQAAAQLTNLTERAVDRIDQRTQAIHNNLSSLAENPAFTDNFAILAKEQTGSTAYLEARNHLSDLLMSYTADTPNGQGIRYALLDPKGALIVSNVDGAGNANVAEDAKLSAFLPSQTTAVVYDDQPGALVKFGVLSSLPILDQNGNLSATLFGVDTTLGAIFQDIGSGNPNSLPFILPDGSPAVGIRDNQTTALDLTPSMQSQVNSVLQTGKNAGALRYTKSDGSSPLAYGKRIPAANADLIVELPLSVVYKQYSPIVLYTGIIFILALLVFGATFFYFTTAVINPLDILVKRILGYTEGEWYPKIPVWRNDEFGLLAQTFNRMTEQLTGLYHSMDTKIQERTRHLRAASDVAQITTTTREMPEILKKTVSLLVERFGAHYAAIFLLNESGSEAILREASGEYGRLMKTQKFKLAIGPQSLVGWVAQKNQTKIIDDVSQETSFTQQDLMANTRSEAAIPIAIGQQVLGVMSLQSPQLKNFTIEIIGVLQTLANQLAVAIQNTRSLESARMDLQETTTLYRATRQITQSTSQEEIIEHTIQALQQIPYGSALLVPDAGELRILFICNTHQQQPDQYRPGTKLPYSSYELSLSKNTPTIIPELDNSTAKLSTVFSLIRSLDCQSAALLPFSNNQELLGLIVLGATEPSFFSQPLLQPFANLTETIGSTFEKLSAYQLSRKRLAETQTIHAVNAAIAKETDLHQLIDAVRVEVAKGIGDADFLVAVYDVKSNMIEMPYIFQGAEAIALDPFPMGEGLTSYVIKNRKTVLINKDAESQAAELGINLSGSPSKSWLGVPLIAAGEIVGALIVQDAEHENRFGEDELSLMTTLAPQVANAIRSTLLLADTQKVQHSLDQEKILLNSLLDNIPDKIFFKRKDGRYIRASKSFARSHRIAEAEQVIGKTDLELVGEEQAAKNVTEDQSILQSGQSVTDQIFHDVEAAKWSRVSKIPIRDAQQQPYAIMGITRDIDDQVNQEQNAAQRSLQLQTAAEIAREVSATFNVSEVFRSVTRKIVDRFGHNHVGIYIWDPVEKAVFLKEAVGENSEKLKQENQAINESFRLLIGQAVARKEIQVVNNTATDPTYYPNPLLVETKSEVVIPLQVGSRFLGVLDIHSKSPNAFTPEDINILRIISDQLAVTIVNAELFARSQNNLVQHRLIHQITAAASASSTVNEAMATVIESLKTTMPGSRIAIYFVDTDHSLLQLRVYTGYDEAEITGLHIRVGEGITGWVAESRKPALVEDTELEPRYIRGHQNVRSELAVPIIYRDELIGVLNFEHDRPMHFDENDQELMSTLAGSLGAIIANARLVEQIRQQVDRQQQLYEVTSKIRRSTNVDTIIQTSATELAKIVGARRAKVQITIGQTASHTEAAGGNGNGNGVNPEGSQ